ncbi:MAG TPA: DUF721 domain-containing protein, partial [Candidatus Melainabacteria bacterium]|nr:DUF721 domain-containing protein [Candidatus Melainabacteria bacterium]
EVPVLVRSGRGGRRNKKFSSLSTVLSRVVNKYGIEKRLREHTFMSMWSHVVGEPWASLSRPVFFDYERNLVVAVKDSAVAQELSLRKHDILTNLHKMARSVGINLKGLRFDIKGYSRLKILEEQIAAEALLRESGGTQGPREPSKEELAALELNPEELAELENFKENLAPSEVSSRFFEIYERDLRRRAWRQRNASLVSGNCGSCGNAELRLHGENRLCGPCFVVSAAFLKDKNA